MSHPSRHKFVSIAVSAAALLVLSGCAAGGATAQSKTEACKSLETSMTSVTSGLNSSFSSLSSNPTAAVKKLQQVTDAFDNGLKKISNPSIKKVAVKADGSLTALTAEVKKDLADPQNADSASLEKASTAVETDFTAVGKACA